MTIKENFNYKNIEIKTNNGEKTIRKVLIKNGKGYKSITKYRRGKKISSVKKPIHFEDMNLIKGGTFVKGLFSDCKKCNKTRKNKN
jgi:hypothetical protein